MEIVAMTMKSNLKEKKIDINEWETKEPYLNIILLAPVTKLNSKLQLRGTRRATFIAHLFHS